MYENRPHKHKKSTMDTMVFLKRNLNLNYGLHQAIFYFHALCNVQYVSAYLRFKLSKGKFSRYQFTPMSMEVVFVHNTFLELNNKTAL